MKAFVGSQEALTASEFIELAYGLDELPTGIDRELFIGVQGESHEERAARLDVAREVLADLRERGERDEIAACDARFAAALAQAVPLRRRSRTRRASGTEVAA